MCVELMTGFAVELSVARGASCELHWVVCKALWGRGLLGNSRLMIPAHLLKKQKTKTTDNLTTKSSSFGFNSFCLLVDQGKQRAPWLCGASPHYMSALERAPGWG